MTGPGPGRITPAHRYRNNDTSVGVGNAFWDASEAAGLAGIVAELRDGVLHTADGHAFVNFSCCSYLDLDAHPKVVEGAVEALRRYGVLDHCIPRSRVQIPALLELEASLGELFGADAVSAISASAASAGLLPLIASGHLGDGVRPLMVFDRTCHVSMAQTKPVCADETEVATCRHHDLDFVEDACRRHARVCYVVDGSDSLGGYAPVAELAALQDRYGLTVFYDDSHSLSAYGRRGAGYVRTHSPALDERTVVVCTLNKAFGGSGAVVLLNGHPKRTLRVIERFGGALSYSQPLNTAAVGAGLASAEIHRTAELTALQDRLQRRIALFDALVGTAQAGSAFPIRLVPVADDAVIEAGRRVYRAGCYVSPVFFPIVARGTAGLRVMLRAGHTEEQVRTLAAVLREVGAPAPAAAHAAAGPVSGGVDGAGGDGAGKGGAGGGVGGRRAVPRSVLYTPALPLERVLAARAYDADVHLVDLEDSVPAPDKERARQVCLAALERAADPSRTAVRINPLGTLEAVRDLALLAGAAVRPGFVFMTMVRFPAEPVLLRETFASAGWRPLIYATVETVEAVRRVDAIAAACDGLILGSADLAATLGIEIGWDGLLAARQAMALACARYGAGCLDTGNFRLADEAALREEIDRSRALGFHGKGTVHPRELPAINRAFRPDPAELRAARRVLAAVREAGDGIAVVDGQMVGPPFVRRARAVLAAGEAWTARFGGPAGGGTDDAAGGAPEAAPAAGVERREGAR